MRKLRTGLNFPLYIRHALPTYKHEKSGYPYRVTAWSPVIRLGLEPKTPTLGARTQDPNIKSVVLYLLS